MKLNKLVVIVSNKKGNCYQVNLDKSETDTVINLVSQLHNDKIKITKPKLSMTIEFENPKLIKKGII